MRVPVTGAVSERVIHDNGLIRMGDAKANPPYPEREGQAGHETERRYFEEWAVTDPSISNRRFWL